MIQYHCDEAILRLSNVRSLVDVSRQMLEIVTEDGLELHVLVARTPLPTEGMKAAIEENIAERRRSLRGFELMSSTPREYAEIAGTEVRVKHIDSERGPLFIHEFHCTIGRSWIAYYGTCRLAEAAACDAWMQQMLQDLVLRD
mgnify:CR=1 FL=1